jgi:hypothetical protein
MSEPSTKTALSRSRRVPSKTVSAAMASTLISCG